MQLLITGITGFVGSHMAEHALAQGAEVFGSFRWRSKTDNIDHLRSRSSSPTFVTSPRSARCSRPPTRPT